MVQLSPEQRHRQQDMVQAGVHAYDHSSVTRLGFTPHAGARLLANHGKEGRDTDLHCEANSSGRFSRFVGKSHQLL